MKKYLIAVPVVLTIAWAIRYECLIRDLQNRFPYLDNKDIRKAYKRMLMKAARGEYPQEMLEYTDGQMDCLFLKEVYLLHE